MEDSVRGLTFLFNILIALTQDITPNIYCNKKYQTWTEALEECFKAQGDVVSYETGTGKDVAHINLNSVADVWTADYAWKGLSPVNGRLCGFNFLTKNYSHPQVMYGDCYVKRYYLCKKYTTMELEVLESNRDNVRCKATINADDLQNNREIIIPGYYWIKDNFYISKGTAKEQRPSPTPSFCGAFSTKIGKYYVDCTTRRSSLCHTNANLFISPTTFDKTCFHHGNASAVTKPTTRASPLTPKSSKTSSSIVKTTSLTSQLPSTSFSTTTQTTVKNTSTSLYTAATPVETIETSSAEAITNVMARPTHTVTHYSWTPMPDGGKVEKSEGNEQSLGVSVGLPVGLCITLICGIILGIFVFRRYKCWKTQGRESGTKDVVSWNNISSTRQNVARFNKHNEKNAVNIFNQTATNDEPTQKKENVYTDSFPEYAVVTKNDIKQVLRDQKENSPSRERKTESVHNSEMDGNSSYCYAEFGNKDNQLANSNGIQTSEYSFAKETPEDMDDIGEKHVAVKEDEYDVTSSKPSYKTSDNIYNKLQKENYYSDTNVRRGGNSRNQESESVYDSANQICPSGPTDNIYTHFSQGDTYSDVSTRNEDKILQSKLTDQTYDQLK